MGWLGWTKSDSSGENHKSSYDVNAQTSKSEKLSGKDGTGNHEHVWTKTTVDARNMVYKNESGFMGKTAERSRDRK